MAMNKTLKSTTFIIGLLLAGITLAGQILWPAYNHLLFSIDCLFISVVLGANVIKCIRTNFSLEGYRLFYVMTCTFLICELPAVYKYRNAEDAIQQDVSRYIQTIIIILAIGLVSMVVLKRKLQKTEKR